MTALVDKLRHSHAVDEPGDALGAEAIRLRVDADYMRAILDVESGDRAYDDRGRLDLLPEKHRFYAELPETRRAAAVRAGLAVNGWQPKTQYKGLGAEGDDRRWDRLDDMTDVDESAALRATSFGKSQIMGRWFADAGYRSPQSFVEAMAANESNQDRAFVTLLERWGLVDELREQDSRAIARAWNGAGQVGHYADLIDAKYRARSGRDVAVPPARQAALRLGSDGSRVVALQERLIELGFRLGEADGDFGEATRRAVFAFQGQHGLKADGIVGPKTQAALDHASPLDLPGREDATTADVRDGGSRIIANSDRAQVTVGTVGGGAIAVGGGTTVVTSIAEQVPAARDAIETINQVGEQVPVAQQAVESAQAIGSFVVDHWWIVVPAVCVVVFLWLRNVKRARLSDHRLGKTL